MQIKTVNISDIDELSEFKVEISKYEESQGREKVSLQDVMLKYCNLVNYVYLHNDEIMPFSYKIIDDICYLFIYKNDAEFKEESLNKIKEQLTKTEYDLTKLDNINMIELATVMGDQEKGYEVMLVNKTYKKLA